MLNINVREQIKKVMWLELNLAVCRIHFYTDFHKLYAFFRFPSTIDRAFTVAVPTSLCYVNILLRDIGIVSSVDGGSVSPTQIKDTAIR